MPLPLSVRACVVSALCLGHPGNVRADPPAAQAVFDGATLAGWEGNPAVWRVEDGAITAEIRAGETMPQNEFIFLREEVHDFELTAEFRISGGPTANSGIQYRAQKLPDGSAAGYQADLDDGAMWLGRIYDEHGRALLVERGTRVSIAPDGRRWVDEFAKPESFKALPKPDGGWNTYRITATGPHVELRVNGTLCAVLDDHQADAADFSGRIAFQMHSGAEPAKVQFRNLRLTQLGRTAPPAKTVEVPSPASPPAPAAPATDAALVANLKRLRESPVLWHLRPNPAAPTAVANASAQKVVSGMMLTDGFQAELIAAEPEVHQPIAMAIDERGRLWVAEAYSYPIKRAEGKGTDRIVIFEDKDGDGAFETRKVFVEGLNLVSGLEVGFGGVWVGAAPQLLFFPDRNRDDRPDGPPEVLLDGWGYQDTHETLNSFTWGPDGWLYGNTGVFTKSKIGPPGTPDAQRVAMRAGVWRYQPVRREFEVFATGGSNQWGIDFNEAGHLFITHCRSFEGGGGTSHVIRNGHFWNQANSDYAPFISNRAPDFAPGLKNFLPAAARYDSGEGGAGKPGTTAVYGGHSHVGTMIYLGDNWPAIYRDHLFTHNLHGHQLNQQHSVRQGSGYETFHAGFDLLMAPDPAYIPIDLQCGPDGAVYMIDWTDRQHCHNPRDEIWDRTNGRLYRVSWAQTYRPVSVDLTAESDRELATLHTHRSEWYVRTARRLLQERAAARPIDATAVAILRAQAATTPEVTPVLRALWTLHAIGDLDRGGIANALKHPSDVVRAWAVQLGTERPDAPLISPVVLAHLVESDPSPTVRLALASALPALPAPGRFWLGAALSMHGEDADDRFLPKMIWFGIAPQVHTDVGRAVELARKTAQPVLADSILWYAARTPAGRDGVVAFLADAPPALATRGLRVLGFSLETETRLAMPPAWPRVAQRFATDADAGVRALAEELSALFGDQAVLARHRALLANRSADLAARQRAFALLKRAADPAALPVYVRLLDDDAFRAPVVPHLAGTDDPAAAAGLLKHFNALDPATRAAALNTLTSRPTFAVALLEAMRDRRFESQHVTALHVRQMRSLHDPAVDRLVERVWGKSADTSEEAKATIARFQKTYAEAPLWAYSGYNGKQVFGRLCATCHTIDGEGGKLGPDLTGSWRNGANYFFENIIDPNAVVGLDYQLNVIARRDGATVSGMVENETDTAVVLRTATDTVTIPKDQIKNRELTAQSLMPPGLLESLPEKEAIDLLKFLADRTK